MITSRLVRILLIIAIIMANIGCDQVSKKVVRKNIEPFEAIHLLNNHLTLTRVENTGAFLSAGDSLPKSAKNILFAILPVIALAMGIAYITVKKNLSTLMLIGFCFVIGGGTGNVFDRIAYGSVTDFLHFNFGVFQTGVFNLADMSIMLGTGIILFQTLRKKTV
jgi:signal peptidase II